MTIIRVLKPSSTPLAINDNVGGARLDNLSFGVLEVPPKAVVAAMAKNNISFRTNNIQSF